MVQFSKVLLAIDKVHTVLQRSLDCGPGLGWLNQVYRPNHPTPPVYSICVIYINIFTRCTHANHHDILLTAVANNSKGQTDMSYKGELQTLTKLSMKHQVCPGETCRTTTSGSIITIPRGRSNCGVIYYVSIYY